MSIVWLIYFAGIVYNIGALLVVSAIVCLLVYGFWWIPYLDYVSRTRPYPKLLYTGIACCIFAVLLPSERIIYTMAGAYAVEQIATSDGAQEIGSKVIMLINQKLDSELSKGK